MIQSIKDFIAQYSAPIVAVITTIVSCFTFFSKVKSLVTHDYDIKEQLRNGLFELKDKYKDLTEKCIYNQEHLTEQFEIESQKIKNYEEEIELLHEQVNSLNQLVKDNEALKKQITSLLRELHKGE